ncbi:MAG TPA: hypothetical protein VKB54_07605 [Solirubrobacteraceae bacterium]|nr:hypothetical protein [Solirubrobacteraceae bacterium]
MSRVPADHHSEYLARTLEALTPEGHERVDQLLDQLAEVVGDREWLVRFAKARRTEADLGRPDRASGADPGLMLSRDELYALLAGFKTIRDEEPLDDVGDWANAVVALLEDEKAALPD